MVKNWRKILDLKTSYVALQIPVFHTGVLLEEQVNNHQFKVEKQMFQWDLASLYYDCLQLCMTLLLC